MPRPARKPARPSTAGEDPVVRSIRAVRAKILRQGGGTVEGYFEVMRKLTERRLAATKKRKGRAA